VRAFSCLRCHHLAPFESVLCLNCGADHGFDWARRELLALLPDVPDGALRVVGEDAVRSRCDNRETAACNGLTEREDALCAACALTRTRPADGDAAGLAGFATAEAAKRRLVFELAELGLPVQPRGEDGSGLAFDMLSSAYEPVTTGHADGVITIDLAEADDAHREAVREQMSEPYRTLLGHLRHEVGHYYEPLLVGTDDEDRCRALFGDEREDYGAALQRHYDQGPPPDWEQRHVSAYATMHPWEDWAETFAHYLHIRDTLQTAASYGVQVEGPRVPTADEAPLSSEPERAGGDFRSLLDAWLPLTYALNALNRSMGAEDLYPFVLAPAVIEKLEFIHELVGRAAVERPLAAAA
jgi:hypothetical protein